MRKAIYAGSFDPITFGHIDVIDRAASIFDEVIVLIATNSKKQNLFSKEQRLEMAKDALKHIANAKVEIFDGLIVDYAIDCGAVALIRGLRSVSDFEYEMQIALMNRKMHQNLQTVFLMPHEKYTYLNSSIVRELARYNRDVSDFVPALVCTMLKEKFPQK